MRLIHSIEHIERLGNLVRVPWKSFKNMSGSLLNTDSGFHLKAGFHTSRFLPRLARLANKIIIRKYTFDWSYSTFPAHFVCLLYFLQLFLDYLELATIDFFWGSQSNLLIKSWKNWLIFNLRKPKLRSSDFSVGDIGCFLACISRWNIWARISSLKFYFMWLSHLIII